MKFQESADRFRMVVEDQTEIISRISADGTLLFVNDVYCRFFGKTAEELLGNKWQPVAYPDDLLMIEAKLATLSPERPVVVIENRVYSGSGEVHWFQFVNRGFFDDQGRLVESQAVGRNITELKEAEAALRVSRERLSLALSASHMGVWDWDAATDQVYWSPECYRIFEHPGFSGTLSSFFEVMHPDDIAPMMAAARNSLEQGSDFTAEFRVLRPDGEVRWVSDHGRPIFDESGRAVRLAGTVLDVTERRRSDEHLQKLREKMNDLSAHLETVREMERQAISREIHDGIGQTLTALKLDLAWLKHRIQPATPEVAERLKDMRHSIDALILKAQHMTAELRPPLLDNLGLTAAVQWQLREFGRRSGIECRFVPPEALEPLPGHLATAVVRILQEALTNVARHAQATQVEVCLFAGEDALELEIFDNGIGISAAQVSSTTSFGIMGMQERARLCQGELEVYGRSGPEHGTTVCLTVPLEQASRVGDGGPGATGPAGRDGAAEPRLSPGGL